MTYQWYQNTTNSTTGATKITGATASSYVATVTASDTYYFCTITDDGGTLNSRICCVSPSKTTGQELVPEIYQVGNTKFENLTDAINSISTEGTIKVLRDNEESTKVIIPAGKNITIDLNLSQIRKRTYAIVNKGTLTIKNDGEICTNINAGNVDGNTNPLVEVIHNTSGNLTIGTNINKDDPMITHYGHIKTYGNAIVASAGNVTVNSGTIIAENGTGLKNTGSGTTTVGRLADNLSTEAPLIQGSAYGVNAVNGFNFYNGVLKGINWGHTGATNAIRPEHRIKAEEETIEEEVYNKEYLIPISNEEGEELSETDYSTAFYISNLAELKLFRDKVNGYYDFAGKTVYLTADIDLAGENWVHIGTETNPFRGKFDGNGYKIKNLTIDKTTYTEEYNSTAIPSELEEGYTGFFGYVESGEIRNVYLQDGTITTSRRVGGIVGHVLDSNIINCTNDGCDIIKSGNYLAAGGIVAETTGTSSTIVNCVNKGDVTNERGAAGILGYANGYTLVSNCINSGTIKNTGDVGNAGGIVGRIDNGRVEYCINNGTVNAAIQNVGGIVGYSYYDAVGPTISHCMNTGNISTTDVTSGTDAGGIAGD